MKFLENIISLRHKSEEKMINLGRRAKVGHEFLKHLYIQPIINATQICERLGITAPSANLLAKQFEKLGILKEMTGFKRNRLFLFSEYLSLFEKVKKG